MTGDPQGPYGGEIGHERSGQGESGRATPGQGAPGTSGHATPGQGAGRPGPQTPPSGAGGPGSDTPSGSAGGPGPETPPQGVPGHGSTDYENPGYGAPGYDAPGYDAPGYDAPGYGAPGYGPGQGMPYGAPGGPGYTSGYDVPGHHGYGAPGYGYRAAGPYVPGQYGPRPGTDDTNMAMLAHLSGLGNLIAWPLGAVGSLVIYMTRKDQSPYVRDQAAEALNFWITATIAFITVTVVSTVLSVVLIGVLGYLLLPVIWVYTLVVGIMGTMAANRGENYRYPMTIRLVT
ncbi:DUF4870 domain-containing protein [Microtetraspora fusca]|uniref:DUF4870 domain-containing protein n=1 Tax=Microtetraspora fusca TaxID=1997 RepID=A0ABW6V2M7_MICFU